MQSIDSKEAYAYGMRKYLVSEKEEIKCNNMIKKIQKLINFDDVTKENKKEHNINWPEIWDHPYRMLIFKGSGSGKMNSLFYLISYQWNIDQMYLYA